MTTNTQNRSQKLGGKRPVRIVFALLLPLLLITGLIVWRLHANATAAKALQQTGGGAGGRGAAGRGPTSVAVASAAVRDIIHTFSTSANIESPETVKISPRVAEQITAITVKEGDPVHQGQILAQLDDTQLAAAARKEQALLAEGNAKLLQAEVTQTSVLTPVQTLIRQNKAALKASQINYRETPRILCPVHCRC